MASAKDRNNQLANETKKKFEAIKKNFDEQVSMLSDISNRAFGLMNEIFEKEQSDMEIRHQHEQNTHNSKIANYDDEIARYRDLLAKKEISQEAHDAAILSIEEKKAKETKALEDRQKKERNELKRKQFEADKAQNIVKAILDTASAIMGILPWAISLGPIAGPIYGSLMGAFIAATSAAQIGIIASQKFVPELASGGLIRGAGTGTSDSIQARVSSGEYVIDAQQTDKIRESLDNKYSGGNTINIEFNEGSIVTREIDDELLDEIGSRMAERVRSSFVNR